MNLGADVEKPGSAPGDLRAGAAAYAEAARLTANGAEHDHLLRQAVRLNAQAASG